MSGPIVVTVPGNRAMLLSANDRHHWRKKAERTRYWRQLAAVCVHAAQVEQLTGRVHITVTFAWPDRRRRDVGNLAPTVKAIVDGLVDGGLLPDDDDKHVLGPDIRRVLGHEFTVQVMVEAVDGAA